MGCHWPPLHRIEFTSGHRSINAVLEHADRRVLAQLGERRIRGFWGSAVGRFQASKLPLHRIFVLHQHYQQPDLSSWRYL